MANPFKDAEKKNKVTPPHNNREEQPEPKEVEQPQPKSEASEGAPVTKDFLAQFVEPKSEGKTHSVYLSNEAGKKLEKLAKQLKCSKSKALDILIKNTVE